MFFEEDCLLCAHRNGESFRPKSMGQVVECKTCGQYECYSQDNLINTDWKASSHLVSALIRRHNRATGRPYMIADRGGDGNHLPHDLIEPPITNKIDAVLGLFASRSEGFGSEAEVDPRADWPLVQAHDKEELDAIVQHLINEKLVSDCGSMILRDGWAVKVTSKGWERVEQSTQKNSASKAFIAMSFDASLTAAYEHGLSPALEGCGWKPIRVDREHHNEKICDRILSEIRSSGLLVSDVTLHRQGVYFEAGFAMGLEIPVIWTCRVDDIDNAHFDTRQYNHIVWETPSDLRRMLAERLSALFPAQLGRSAPVTP